MVGRTGRYLEIGNINPGLTYQLDPSTLVFGNRSILGMVYYEAEHLQQALDLMRRTRDRYPWQRVISHTFPLEQINERSSKPTRGGSRARRSFRSERPSFIRPTCLAQDVPAMYTVCWRRLRHRMSSEPPSTQPHNPDHHGVPLRGRTRLVARSSH